MEFELKKNPKKIKSEALASKTATYRVLARQPLSMNVAPGASFNNFSIQGITCRIAVRPASSDPATQHKIGGSLLAIEFDYAADEDLLVVARNGFELIEDFLSAIAIASGMPLRPSELVQVMRFTSEDTPNCEFLQLLQVSANHWQQPISPATIGTAKNLLAHWDGLETGKRLRRAARQYRESIGNFDDVAAFQEAYIGLEAMEPPLAKMAGLTPGTEETKGKCQECGAEFIRKKTSLVGVRSFVIGALNPKEADEQRKSDWKLINDLRNKLMHGLVDEKALDNEPHKALMASMHYLHSGICMCSHAENLIKENYRLARGGICYVLWGTFMASTLPALSDWSQILETSKFTWVPHTSHGFVPEIKLRNSGHKDLHIGLAYLTGPISFATIESLKPAKFEGDFA